MNRRGFIGLLAGALPAMALSNKKYFFAPMSGWTIANGIWTNTNVLGCGRNETAFYKFIAVPRVSDPEGLVSGYWRRVDVTGKTHPELSGELSYVVMKQPFGLDLETHWHWSGYTE